MGFFDGLLGNASKIDNSKIQNDFGQILTPNEVVEHAYQVLRDYFVFTNKRLVLVDIQGLTGKKLSIIQFLIKALYNSVLKQLDLSILMQN